jgi:hypothetical protein
LSMQFFFNSLFFLDFMLQQNNYNKEIKLQKQK